MTTLIFRSSVVTIGIAFRGLLCIFRLFVCVDLLCILIIPHVLYIGMSSMFMYVGMSCMYAYRVGEGMSCMYVCRVEVPVCVR